MRYNIYENGGSVEGLITISGMVARGYVRLRNDPNEPNEAASRQYVETLLQGRPATAIKSGSFNKEVLPALNDGGVTSTSGSSLLTLKNSGVLLTPILR